MRKERETVKTKEGREKTRKDTMDKEDRGGRKVGGLVWKKRKREEKREGRRRGQEKARARGEGKCRRRERNSKKRRETTC